MSKKYVYLTTIHDAETDELVGQIEALSLESHEERWHKVPAMLSQYENRKEEKQDTECSCNNPASHNNGEETCLQGKVIDAGL